MNEQEALADSLAYKILDCARWAPSGDNFQPWKFEILNAGEFVVHGHECGHDRVYDNGGFGSYVSIGALLENVAIAASRFGAVAEITTLSLADQSSPSFRVCLESKPDIAADPLHAFIQGRSVHRGRLSTRRLSAEEKKALESCLGGGYQVVWFEGLKKKLDVVRLVSATSKLRLTTPEARPVHAAIIEWNAQFSETRIPDAALCVSPLTRMIMRWALRRWLRVDFLNRYLAGTWMPRLEMDWIPGLFCGAHFLLLAPHRVESIEDCIAAGRVMQRFWLSASALGLKLQPQFAPIVFSRYARARTAFTETESCLAQAEGINGMLQETFGVSVAANGFFLGRIGAGEALPARSLRLKLEAKLINSGMPEAESIAAS